MSNAETIALRGGIVVTQDAQRRVFRGDVLLRGPRVEAVGETVATKADREIDARGFLIAPGFVNLHTHVANALLRGVADDLDFGAFLDTMFAFDAHRTEADLEAGSLLGIAEMLLGGTTSFLDMYYGEDAVARACEHLGMRGYLGWTVLDPEVTTQKGIPLDNAAAFARRWKDHALVQPLVSLQGVYVCKEETWRKSKELAERERMILHYHLSETLGEVEGNVEKYGKRPVEWLDSIGFLGPRQVAAHSAWLTNGEIETIGARGVATAHCPSSNMKLATGGGGLSPVTELRARGVAVGLGTDSSTSNNTLSMLREMHLAGLAHKHARHDPKSLPAQVLLDMATRNGARALGAEKEIGTIAPGFRADLVLYDLHHPSLAPTRPEQAVANIVYSANEGAVHTVFVEGKAVVESGRLTGAPVASIADRAVQEWEALEGRVRKARATQP